MAQAPNQLTKLEEKRQVLYQQEEHHNRRLDGYGRDIRTATQKMENINKTIAEAKAEIRLKEHDCKAAEVRARNAQRDVEVEAARRKDLNKKKRDLENQMKAMTRAIHASCERENWAKQEGKAHSAHAARLHSEVQALRKKV